MTLVGLIAEGGQGMRTANNARFLAYLAGSERAQKVVEKRTEWTNRWLARPAVAPVFRQLIAESGGDPQKPLANIAAWEATAEALRGRFRVDADLGFGRTDLYRVVAPALLADATDFDYAWDCRRAELLAAWRDAGDLRAFWTQVSDNADETQKRRDWHKPGDLPDASFCEMCQAIVRWAQ